MKLTLLCFAYSIPCTLCLMNGEDVQADEDTRFIVSLQTYNQEGKHFCGGVFVTLDFVLTAASCVEDRQPQDFWIVAGTKKLSNKNEQLQLKIDKVFSMNPSGRNKVRNNIALLRIETNIPKFEVHKVHKIELASDGEDNVAEGKNCKMYGWGQKEDGDKVPTDILQVGPTQVKPWDACNLLLEDVDESNLCAQNYMASLCNFDAGAPLISESGNYLLGIATEHFKVILPDYYDVYTRVNSHKHWIWKTIETNKKVSSSTSHPKSNDIITGIGIIIVSIIWASP
ncbi:mite allergen Eur m 3-like isoform X2 [Bradysia coprophila]|uniref:mite allergen Eur m 3-like isoform X2 n=1 Tax=Bradysia coprophila TaxID=38358 RepID=UPI00187DB5BF|nr:mite allergen Eur m 3-like isoform X2 [Bradysia coprophila]